MRLISKFHDYYDTALSEGRDETIVYVRDRSLDATHISNDLLPWAAPSTRGWRNSALGPRSVEIRDKNNTAPYRRLATPPGHYPYDEAFVVLAGKAYPVWVKRGSIDALLGESQEDLLGSPTIEPLVDGITSMLMTRRHALLKEPKIKVREGFSRDEDERMYGAARSRFLGHDFTDLNLDLGAPVLLVAHAHTLLGYRQRNHYPEIIEADRRGVTNALVIKNPRLVDLGFQRSVHPYTCFQEIAQFIDGVIPGRHMPMATLSDKSKILKRGFDPVYGFRKRPQG